MLSKENKETISRLTKEMSIDDIIELKKILDCRKENYYQEMISKLENLKNERRKLSDEINSIRNELQSEASRLRLEGDIRKSREFLRLAEEAPGQSRITEDISAVSKSLFSRDLSAGDYVTFGHYPQGLGDDTNAPVTWMVLKTEGDKALLLSKYVLDCFPYNRERRIASWDDCSLKNWLNGEFLRRCFKKDEICRISPEEGVSILSFEELVTYLDSEAKRSCYGTIYALKNGTEHFIDSTCVSYAVKNNNSEPDHLSVITPLGGVCVNKEITDCHIGVRPAVWVRYR